MSTRDDAIKAVQVAALKKWAPRMDGLTTWEAGVVVDAGDPIIRADEREKSHVHNTGTSSPDACCECCYDVPSLERDHLAARRRVKELVDERADLRAKVEEWDKRYTLVEVSDVLALLPEERDRG